MRLTDLAAWPDTLDDLRFSPAREQPSGARRLIVLVDGTPIGELDICPTGWHLSIVNDSTITEHVFWAADSEAAFDTRALAIWVVRHVLRALDFSAPRARGRRGRVRARRVDGGLWRLERD